MSIINEIDLSNTGLTTRSNRFNSSINVNDNACDDFIESEKNLGGAQIVETYENDLYKWKPNHLLMSNFYTYVINNESIYDTTYNNMVNLYNSIIDTYNESKEEGSTERLEHIETQKKFIDYNRDKKYEGKEE